MVESLITEMRASVDGELTSRSKVVDHLLDLRLAARSHIDVVVIVDRLLAELPGRSTVPNVWWLGALADIERVWRPLPVAASPQTSDPASVTAVPPPLPRRHRPE